MQFFFFLHKAISRICSAKRGEIVIFLSHLDHLWLEKPILAAIALVRRNWFT